MRRDPIFATGITERVWWERGGGVEPTRPHSDSNPFLGRTHFVLQGSSGTGAVCPRSIACRTTRLARMAVAAVLGLGAVLATPAPLPAETVAGLSRGLSEALEGPWRWLEPDLE